MSVKIRLQLFGSRHKPFYRVVAIDAHNKRNGKFLEI
ncbi:MAG: 30S ribosomal protein S16, partial [Sweet potato little leaf phytoplasma]|nr:30S ribosomal protein S16 [Sweet potato little leaf phytoplasma]